MTKIVSGMRLLLWFGILLTVCGENFAMAAGCSGTVSEKLEELLKKKEKCSSNKGKAENVNHASGNDRGSCEGAYKSTEDAIKDLKRKRAASCQAVGKQAGGQTGCTGKGSSGCQSDTKDIAGNAKKMKQDEAKASRDLANWLKEKAEKAQQAAAALNDAAASRPSDVTQKEAAKEQQDAAKHAKDAADEMEKEAVKSEAAANEAEKVEKKSGEKKDQMNSAPTDKQAASKSGEEAGKGGAGGGAPQIPSIPGSGAGGSGDTAASTPLSPTTAPNSSSMDGQETLAPGTTTGNSAPNSGKSTSKDLNLDTTPKKSGSDDVASAEGPLNSSGSSKLDTSLRDSLKKKLLGSAATGGSGEALGGLPFGGSSGAAGKGKAGEGSAAGIAASGGSGHLDDSSGGGGGGGSGDSGDFSMARSETDAAVKNLINEFGASGDNQGDSRNLADIDSAASGIEGADGGNLFFRVRGTINRKLQKGDVVNGVNGKI